MDEYNQDIPATPAIEAAAVPKRPVFLTVLCILTFVGSGLSIAGGLFSFATAQWTADRLSINSERLKNMDDLYGNHSSLFSSMYGKEIGQMTAGFIMAKAGLGVLGSLLTLGGGLLMFRLLKAGFYVYLGGHAIAIGVMFVMGSSGFIGSAGIAFNLVFILLFIILYSINYKHLVR